VHAALCIDIHVCTDVHCGAQICTCMHQGVHCWRYKLNLLIYPFCSLHNHLRTIRVSLIFLFFIRLPYELTRVKRQYTCFLLVLVRLSRPCSNIHKCALVHTSDISEHKWLSKQQKHAQMRQGGREVSRVVVGERQAADCLRVTTRDPCMNSTGLWSFTFDKIPGMIGVCQR